jgi:integrase
MRDREDEPWSEAQSRDLYAKALTEAGQIASRSVSTGFEERRKRTFDEFTEFMEKVGHGVSIDTASDLDVLAFIQGWWLPAHQQRCRTFSADGEKVASAAAMNGIVQHIGKSYSILGRTDQSNPAKQESVRSYCDGYRNRLHDQGVREKRARVFKEQKVSDLVSYLEGRIRQCTGIMKCVLMTDLAAVDYFWETWARGKECGELRADQIDFEEGLALPGWSKTIHNEPSSTIELTGDRKGRFLTSAVALIRELDQQGHPPGDGCIFRPMNRQRSGFKSVPNSANALRKRIQTHLKEAGLFAGETLHSFRRSAVQSASQIEGFDVPRLMSMGRWKSYAVFRRYIEEILYAMILQRLIIEDLALERVDRSRYQISAEL